MATTSNIHTNQEMTECSITTVTKCNVNNQNLYKIVSSLVDTQIHTDMTVTGLFVPKTFRSWERNTTFGRFVPWTFRSVDDSFRGRFVPWTFRSKDDSFPYLAQ